MRRCHAAVALAAVTFLVGGCGGETERRDPVRDGGRFVVGQGRTAATVFVPDGGARGRVGVVFLHGWGAVEPRLYGPWIRYLVARGRVVIHPRYQASVASPPPESLPSAVIGIRSAVARTGRLRALVAVGHSAGGALAADLAAVAPRVGLPTPRAVLALYPGRSLRGIPARIPPEDLARIPRTTEVVALAGDDDAVVGAATARAIAGESGGRFRLVRDDAADDHLAPQRADPAARRTFWRELDRLLEGVRPR